MGSICAVACFTASVSQATTPSTGYRIVPGHSVGKVTLDEGTGSVIAAIGPPRGRSTNAGPGWLYGALEVVTNAGQVQVIELIVSPRFGATQSEAAHYTTPAGIHVGSTLAAVEEAYPHAKCNSANQGCVLAGGTRSTKFWVAAGKNELAPSARIIEISVS